MNTSDVIIIGAGHNGLVCAFYLARAGMKVTVLERRGVVGGAAVTEEFHPGFRNSVASYTVSLLNPKIIRDMDLPGLGLRVVERKLQNFLPLNDREYLETGGERTKESVAKFSHSDAAMLEPYGARLGEIADIIRDLMLKTPPNVTEGGWFSAIPEMLKAAGQASHSRSSPCRRGAICWRYSRNRPASIWTVGSKAPRSRRPTASTAWWAITRAPSRRAQAMCCCITCWAR